MCRLIQEDQVERSLLQLRRLSSVCRLIHAELGVSAQAGYEKLWRIAV